MEKFSIIHEFESTQFLVDSAYEPLTKEYHLIYKFWSTKINGFIKATLSWDDKFVDGFNEMFKKFNDPEYCKIFMIGTEEKLVVGDVEKTYNEKGDLLKATLEEKIN